MVVRKMAPLTSLLFTLTLPLMSPNPALAAIPAEQQPQPQPPLAAHDGLAIPPGTSQPLTQTMKFVPGRLIVKLKTGMSVEQLSAVREKHALKVAAKKMANSTHHRFKDLYDVTADKGEDLPALAAELMENDAVEYAEPVTISVTQLVPNDTYYSQQWSHKKTQAEAGWDITTGSSSTIIAVVDTGVAYTHPDLAANIWHDALGNPGKDFVDIYTSNYTNAGYQLITGEDYTGADNDPSDYNGHGTHVSGIIAAVGNNGLGVTGVCPACRIMPVRAGFSMRSGTTDYGFFESDDIANAIIYAADNGAKVINMSFGGSSSKLEGDAISYADSKGVLLVAAAGNNSTSDTTNAYPAVYPNVLAVAATDSNDAKASYSNYGNWVGVAAPGSSIYSTVPYSGSLGNSSGYATLSGTSMASPYVAGLAGLILSKNPGLSNRELAQVIRQGVDVFNVDIANSTTYVGTGRVNVYKALQVNSATAATVSLSSPANDFIAGSATDVVGTASAPYQVLIGAGIYPSSWTQMGSGPAMSGTLATIDPAALIAPFSDYTIKLSAQDENGKVETVVHGTIGKQFLPGWPQKFSLLSTSIWNAPTLSDVDNDGLDEIVITGVDSSSHPLINVFKQDGTQVAGWPQTIPVTGSLQYGATVGDLDGDGNAEIVAPVTDNVNHSLKVWDRWGRLLWTKILDGSNAELNATLADLYGDGHREIITQTLNSKLWVLDSQGNVKWSYPLGEYDSWYNDKVVAVADLDGDGRKEIIKNLVRNIRFAAGDTYRTMGGSLMVFNNDGTVRWKYDWPEAGESLTTKYYEIHPTGSPIVADINNDGSPEIIVKVNAWKGEDTGTTEVNTRFYAFDSNGSILPGWPVSVPGYPAYSELAAGDLTMDGYREVVAGTQSYLVALKYTGSQLFPPIPMNVQGNVTIGDVTGDGKPDIVAFDGTKFNVVQANGSMTTLPVAARNTGWNVHNQPALLDLNKSGTEKLVFLEPGSRPVVWAWDLQVPHFSEAEQWTMFGFDPLHTGVSASPSLSPVAISTSALANGVVGSPYSASLAAIGGTAPYTWSVTKGALPAGVTFNGATGLLSGTPTLAGNFNFTIRAVDAKAASAIRSFSVAASGTPPAMVQGSTTGYFGLLQDAYNSCADGDSIDLQGVFFNEAPTFDRNITVLLQGGFDSSFAGNSGRTVIKGHMSIKNGKVKLSNIVFS